jgi:hypothetical protein
MPIPAGYKLDDFGHLIPDHSYVQIPGTQNPGVGPPQIFEPPTYGGSSGGGGGGGMPMGGGSGGGSYGGTTNMSSGGFMSMDDSIFTPHVTSITPLGGSGSGSGGGGMNSALLSQLLASLQQSQTQANAVNQAQYKQLLASVANTQKGVQGLFGDLDKSGRQQINLQEAQQKGQTEQDLVSRGLGNTTIRSNMLNGVANNAQMQRQNLASLVAGQKLGATMQLGQMQGDAILSRMNQGPDLSTYLGLIQSLTANSGGGSQVGGVVRK